MIRAMPYINRAADVLVTKPFVRILVILAVCFITNKAGDLLHRPTLAGLVFGYLLGSLLTYGYARQIEAQRTGRVASIALLLFLALSAAQGWAQTWQDQGCTLDERNVLRSFNGGRCPGDPPVLNVIHPAMSPMSVLGDGNATMTFRPAKVLVRGQELCLEYSSTCIPVPPGWKLVEDPK